MNTIIILISSGFIFIALASLAVLTYKLYGLNQRAQQQIYALKKYIFHVHKQQKLILNADVGLGKTVEKMRDSLEELDRHQEGIINTVPAEQVYEHAKTLFKTGNDFQTVIDQCGISASEAKVLQRLVQSA